MASKSMKAIKNLSVDELKSKARELEAALFQLRMKKVTGQLSNVNEIWKSRKELARVKTLASQKNTRI
jgi:large subunit ribosomal protein L29